MTSHPYAKKLNDVRGALQAQGLDGFLVPRADRWPGEFVSAGAERLAWLTGFTGSAGVAVILNDKAAVFTDGRYTLQMAAQVDGTLYETYDMAKVKVSEWIAAQAKPGMMIGFDPWLYTPEQIEALQKILEPASIKLEAVGQNPVDGVAGVIAAAPAHAAELFPEHIAGLSSAEKKALVAPEVSKAGASAFIMAMPDSIAWLLNIRGRDVEHTPVVLSHGVLFADGKRFIWFVDPQKIPAVVAANLSRTEIIHPDKIEPTLRGLIESGERLAIDPARTPLWFGKIVEDAGGSFVDMKDPCILPKAMKNATEQDSIRVTHIEDAIAMVKFLAWFDGEAPKGKLTELDVVDRLELFRKEGENYREPSFSTIAGYGPNGAIVHYRATPETNLTVDVPGLLLLDSGGQYSGGTTDITRTLPIGDTDPEIRHHFTLVLKGHIALAAAKFSRTTTGAQLDTLARQPLMREGLNYAHGTGHGVGCYLSVHEEASNISPRGKDALKPGMLLSNEPGYYKEGAHGIRIENLVMVMDEGAFLRFETVTLVPIDRRLIDKDILSEAELSWVNEYHAQVREILAPLLSAPVRAWLEQATAPL